MSANDGGPPPAPSEPPDSPRSANAPGRDGGSHPWRMTALVATGWALGITFLFFVLAVAVAKEDLVSAIACQAIAYLVGLFFILRVHAPQAGIRDFLGMRPTHPLFYPLAILLGVALEVPTDALYGAVERWTGKVAEDGITEVFRSAGAPKRAAIALVVILFGPMLEEVLFRGALFRPMLKVHPAWMVIVVTATLFALAHPAVQMYLPIALVGLVLGVIRRASGSLVPSMLVHATFNAIPFYVMAAHHPGSSGAEPPSWVAALEGDGPIPLWLVAASSAAVLLLLYGVRLVGDRTLDAKLAQEYDRR
jgi:membrane protease YdiL (CAAX protease family)